MYQVTRIIQDLTYRDMEYIQLVGHYEADEIFSAIRSHYEDVPQYDEEDGERIAVTDAATLTVKEAHDMGYRVKMVA